MLCLQTSTNESHTFQLLLEQIQQCSLQDQLKRKEEMTLPQFKAATFKATHSFANTVRRRS